MEDLEAPQDSGTERERAATRHALDPFDTQANNAGALVHELWRDCLSVHDEFYAASKRELDFCLKHDHYETRRGASRDWRRTQPTTPDLVHTGRLKTAEICDDPINIDCRPMDGENDPLAAPLAKSVIEYNLHDPLRRFSACDRRSVMGALAARKWYTLIEWDHSCGPYGNVVFSNCPPWRLHVAPGYVDAHDPQCPWIIHEVDMPLSSVWLKEADGWDVKGLEPDGARMTDDDPQGDTSASGSITAVSGYPSRTMSGRQTIKLLIWRARQDDSVPAAPGMLSLAPEDQIMACAQCGYATQDHQRLEDGSFPPEGDACPQCMTEWAEQPPAADGTVPEVPKLQLISELPEDESAQRNIIGRMVVMAPDHNDHVLYDGPWDCPARSFPIMEYKLYDHPFESFPVSDTFLHWTQQIMLDMCLKSGFLQLMRNGDVIIAPYGGLENADGTPFRFTGEHGNIAYTRSVATAQYVKHFQGTGIAPGLPQFYGMVRDMMLATQGTSDLSMGPAELKQARVGVVEQAAESGEIPVREGRKMRRETLSIGAGLILDYCIHYWTTERWIRTFGPSGQVMQQLLAGDQIANMDVIITAEPQLDQIAMEQLDKLIQWASLPLPTRRLTARLMNMPQTLVEQFEQEMLDMTSNQPLPEDGEGDYPAAEGDDPAAAVA